VGKYRVSAKADRDLLNIWKHIAADNEPAADRVHDLLYEKFRALAIAPGIGVAANHVAPNTRKVPVGEYIIYYRAGRDRILIARVLHGRRRQMQAYHMQP
jgi:toxin ParE1/3/4